MPRDNACRGCVPKKVRCVVDPGSDACQRCIRKGLHCERPDTPANPTTGSATRRTACERCRNKRIRCERLTDTTCRTCWDVDEECVPAPSGVPAANADPVAGPSNAGPSNVGPSNAGPFNAGPSNAVAPPQQMDSDDGADATQHMNTLPPPLVVDTNVPQAPRAGPSNPNHGSVSPPRQWWDVCMTPSPLASEDGDAHMRD